ncbi:hypothetical protein RRG08_062635 [Elysia crispata]|uniref:Uncharacterized protein n=1 Tax=Elysia crispata TaxID=231223 RepID=A0AAE0YY93_9GAST|nr:hypothetical protein RRG08_062635 [Elysia crispata]
MATADIAQMRLNPRTAVGLLLWDDCDYSKMDSRAEGYLVVQVYGGLVDSPGYDNTLRKENIRLESRTSRVGATDSSTGPLEDGCVATLQECYFDLQFHQQKY